MRRSKAKAKEKQGGVADQRLNKKYEPRKVTSVASLVEEGRVKEVALPVYVLV